MKKLYLIALLAGATNVAMAQDFAAPVPQRPIRPDVTAPTPTVEGAIPRAARLGNPAQMVNPLAPRAYGKGEDLVALESNDPFQRPPTPQPRAIGIRLFSYQF
jgi:hypothetical protein